MLVLINGALRNEGETSVNNSSLIIRN